MTDEGASIDRVRELGKARIDLARSIQSAEEWKDAWPEPERAFPFALSGWKQCMCYTVADYAAEVGFLIDVLGLPAPLFGEDNALLTSPDREFYFQVAGTEEGEEPTPPESISLMFHVDNILEAGRELEARGVVFTRPPTSHGGEGSTFHTAEFRTPHGLSVHLWGMAEG